MFTPSTRSAGRTLRWVVLMPVVMVGSLVYWSVAIGLGGLSLMTASALSVSTTDSTTGVDSDQDPSESSSDDSSATIDVAGTPIMVRLEESTEPEDVNDNAGAAGFTQVSDQQAAVTPGPGNTSY
jgi:hypothetical protein